MPILALGLLAAAGVLAGCASTPHNYLDPDRPVYQGSYGASPSPRPERRVVTFNIEYGTNVDQAIEALTSHPALRGADVLLLQEMDAPGVEAIAKALAMNYAYCPSSVSPKTKRDLGTAVLSPWPMEERFKVRLPHYSRMTGHARSVVGARVRIDGRDVRVYSVHFGTLLGLSGSQRREQLQAVLDDARDSSDPVLIGGDFNSKGLAEQLASSGFSWTSQEAGKTWKIFAFDHILMRGLGDPDLARSGVVREVKGVSDHYPLWATFR
jgi:endonuclease/exonuclease/phosphatase family metal-dependent hydrolase